jgi:UDP-N-acetylglucosamine 4,6-dehydratase/5-epimerase
MNAKNQVISKFFKGKNILVTGGTGSVGYELVKQLINFRPRTIRILSNDENSIFETENRLGKHEFISYLMGDIRDQTRLKLALRDIDIVFHAAAMKHVDICESNPFDAIKTNVLGTSNLIEASLLENVSMFVFVSTDKATNPVNTLGASKMLAERLTLDAESYRGKGKTKFCIVRFGNVIGSRGSVIRIFLEQIKHKKNVTVTDKKMTRFIMSISDAISLILQATVSAKGGEIFILKMPAIRISNLANSLIRVYSKRFFNNKVYSKIKITGAGERERFHELLITPEELNFCQDVGNMFKITKKKSAKKINLKNLNSETTEIMSEKRLEGILNKLIDELI